MSVENLTNFYHVLLQNSELLALLTERTKGATKEDFLDKLVELGKEKGYSFSLEDFHKFYAAKLKTVEEGELDDSDLEAVAGGGGKSSSNSNQGDCVVDNTLNLDDPACLQNLSGAGFS